MTDKPSVLRDTDDDARKLARTLLRSARSAALAVLEPGENGFPFVSRALIGIDIDGTPVILVSKLSTHTQALAEDNRCSLLVGDVGKGDPLVHARMTVQCLAEKLERDDSRHPLLRERFLRRHPKAELYVDFPDFAFFRLVPQRASLNGGFGRAYALDGRDLMIASPAIADLAAMEGRAIDHMNSDHADAATRYAKAFCKSTEDGWTITAIDAAGLDLSLGDKLKRLEFDEPLRAAADLRPLLVRLYG